MLDEHRGAATEPLANGWDLMQRKRYKAAIVQFEKAIAMDPLSGDAYGMLGYALYHLGKTEQAVTAFRAGYRRGIMAHLMADGLLGIFIHVLLATGCYAEALGIVEEQQKAGLECVPSVLVGYKGLCLKYLHRYDEALVAFRRAVECDPEEMMWWFNLALTASRCGDALTLEEVLVKLQDMLSRASNPSEAEDIREAIENIRKTFIDAED